MLKRFAWLNGKGSRCRNSTTTVYKPADETTLAVRDYEWDGCLPFEMEFNAWKAAKEENPAAAGMTLNTRGEQPLSPKLESLARVEFIRPDLLSFFWGLIWLLPLAVVIPVLWVTLLCGPSPAQLRQ